MERRMVGLVGCSALATCLLLGPSGCSHSRSGSGVMTPERQRSLTPEQVLVDLREGNERFVAGRLEGRDWMAQARDTAGAQYPKAVVLGCLDSRVPPEVIFDQGIGDIFVGRVAGNFENVDMLGSMEFGTKLAGAKLIVVLGHTSCGAVKGAIDQAELGNLTPTLENIEVAIESVPHTPGERRSSNKVFVDRVTEANVRQTVRDIQARSPVIAEMVRAEKLRVVGAIYDLETGRVQWLDMDS